jgi:hypothetical protein
MDLVAIVCEVEGTDMVARWVQINPKAIAQILGTEQELVEPKTENGITMTVRVPDDLTEVYQDARFPIIRTTVSLDS